MNEDIQLIDDTLTGNSSAFGQLVTKYQDRLYNTLVHVLGCTEEARDVCQDAFVQALTKLSSFRRHSAFYTWLYRIAFNLAATRRRRHKPTMSVEQNRELTGDEPISRDGSPSERIERRRASRPGASRPGEPERGVSLGPCAARNRRTRLRHHRRDARPPPGNGSQPVASGPHGNARATKGCVVGESLNLMDHEQYDLLISAYLDDELNADERAHVEQLLATNAEARQLIDELRHLRRLAGPAAPSVGTRFRSASYSPRRTNNSSVRAGAGKRSCKSHNSAPARSMAAERLPQQSGSRLVARRDRRRGDHHGRHA